MIAEAPNPTEEPLPDLRLTIDIDRPTPQNPDGYIGMIIEEKGKKRMADAADGTHSDTTMKRVLLDTYSYFLNGRGAWANRMKRPDRGDERGR